jgi:ABC-type sugar transport system ATPase subunit
MRDITKNFPGVKALDDVNVNLKAGEILGLLGENGAGKSTLIKILSGDYSLEHGEIIIEGEKKIFNHPHESLDAGIRVIYQELTTFDPLTVAENIFAGEVITSKLGVVNWRRMGKESKEILNRLGSSINPFEFVENLSVAQKQLVEIAKAIRKKAKILVMDEPTSALDEKDVTNLYEVIKRLRKEGVGIIFISHRIEEIYAITDRVVVLRDGKKVGDRLTKDTDRKTLVNLIVGRELTDQYPKQNIKKGEIILEVKNLSYMDRLKDISFDLREGEILALFGLLGSGIHDLLSVLFGDRKKTKGEIYVRGKKVEILNPNAAKANDPGYIPLDRKEEGVALFLSIKQNITSSNIEEMGNGFMFNRKIETERAKKWFDKLDIKAPSLDTIVNSLSGGNQQKVIVAKWLERNAKILLMNEPTRGIDVGTKREIYVIAEELCKQGVGVIMSSSELPEIMGVSDRVIIMRDGKISGIFNTKDTNQEELMHIASA